MIRKIIAVILMNAFLAASSLVAACPVWADKGGDPNRASADAPAKGHDQHSPSSSGLENGNGHTVHDPEPDPGGEAAAI